MKLVLKFDLHADIIELPEAVAKDAVKLKKDFLNWIYSKKSSKKFWKTVTDANGKKYDAVMYDGHVFLEWVNKSKLKDVEKAVYIERVYIEDIDRSLPCIHF